MVGKETPAFSNSSAQRQSQKFSLEEATKYKTSNIDELILIFNGLSLSSTRSYHLSIDLLINHIIDVKKILILSRN